MTFFSILYDGHRKNKNNQNRTFKTCSILVKSGLPGENRTHNRHLGGSRYIHLTTGRFLRFESCFAIQKIQNLYQNIARFASETQYMVVYAAVSYCIRGYN